VKQAEAIWVARARGWGRVDGVGEEGGDADAAVFSREKWGES